MELKTSDPIKNKGIDTYKQVLFDVMEFVRKKGYHIHQNNLDHDGSGFLILDSNKSIVTPRLLHNVIYTT